MEKLLDLKEFLLEKKYYVIGVIIFLLLLGCSIYFCIQNFDNNENKEITFLEENEKIIDEEVVSEECYVNVDIKGEVKVPGLYEVVCDSRVQDVINLAGGITKNGDTTVLNLGKKLEDEMVIIVYSKEEVTNFNKTKIEENTRIESCVNETEIKNDACIDVDNFTNSTIISSNVDNEVIGDTPVKLLVSINKATKEELMTLSGIGESKADNIISYRIEAGGFKSIEELKSVKGIGDSIFEKIKNDITL